MALPRASIEKDGAVAIDPRCRGGPFMTLPREHIEKDGAVAVDPRCCRGGPLWPSRGSTARVLLQSSRRDRTRQLVKGLTCKRAQPRFTKGGGISSALTRTGVPLAEQTWSLSSDFG